MKNYKVTQFSIYVTCMRPKYNVSHQLSYLDLDQLSIQMESVKWFYILF